MMTTIIKLIFFILCFFTAKAHGQSITPSEYMAMGNSGVASAERSRAIFYNPALLANKKGWHFIPIELQCTFNNVSGTKALHEFRLFKDKGTAEKIETFESINGKPIFAESYLGYQIHKDGFAHGVYRHASVYGEIHGLITPILEYDLLHEYVGYLSYGRQIGDTPLRVGANLKSIFRSTFVGEGDVIEIYEDEDYFMVQDRAHEGFGLGADVGVASVLQKNNFQIIGGATLENVGDTKFKPTAIYNKHLEEAPVREMQELDTGVSLAIISGPVITKMLFAYNFEDALNKNPDTIQHGGGLRLWFTRYFSIAGGAYHGYPTGGAEIDLVYLQLGYSTYEEEVGTYKSPVGDRRHVVSLMAKF